MHLKKKIPLKSPEFQVLINCSPSAMIICSVNLQNRTSQIELTGSRLRDFVAQLVGALRRHRRGHGFESR